MCQRRYIFCPGSCGQSYTNEYECEENQANRPISEASLPQLGNCSKKIQEIDVVLVERDFENHSLIDFCQAAEGRRPAGDRKFEETWQRELEAPGETRFWPGE